MAGYHKNFIMKFPHGSVHKLKEEVDEFFDAFVGGNKIMAQQELSDVYLKMVHLIKNYGLSISDLKVMADTTQNVFESGLRTEPSLFDIILGNIGYISPNTTGFIHLLCHDINYHYVIHDYSDSVWFNLPNNTEYVEVVQGGIFIPNNNLTITQGQCVQVIGNKISMHENTIILIKTIGYNCESLNIFSTVSSDKSDIQFAILKRVIETGY